MSTYPLHPRSAFLAWCEVHQAAFTANATAIGMTREQAEAFKAASDAARAADLAQYRARQAARVATQRVEEALARLRAAAGEAVRTIRAFAESGDAPTTVYGLAMIPPIAPHSKAPPPAQPRALTVRLDASTGALTLRWKATNPPGTSGTTYLVRRRIIGGPGGDAGEPQRGSGQTGRGGGQTGRAAGRAGFTFLGVSGKKTFVDDTVPAGAAAVQYTVQGQRADRAGPVSAILYVNLGQAADAARSGGVAASADAGPIPEGRLAASALNGRSAGHVRRALSRA